MWLARALLRLGVQTAVAASVALVVAALQAPFRRESFLEGFVLSLYLVAGCCS